MNEIKKKHINNNSKIALLFLLVFFNFLLYSAFSAIPIFSSFKLEKENLVQSATKGDHSKLSKITYPTSDMEEDFEYSEIEINPFLQVQNNLFTLNSLGSFFLTTQSKYHKSYFYKKSGLFLLFCNLKYHLS
ncbi:hypothetical protein [Flavobacterium polysaccharolyticum]|jgi:hypothetical protein|uniref:Uncharacterized protein n=1 Tax=Flavobacterium polysaccharolyticum TaxID=3133148 RepID=A0ABU9NL43_9FLAO